MKMLLRNKWSVIFSIGSLVALTVTTVLAVKSGTKLEEALDDIEEETTAKEIIKKAAPVLAPTVVSYFVTAAFVIGGFTYGNKVCKAAIAASVSAKALYDDYRQKNIELNGEEADVSVIDAMVEERLKKNKTLGNKVLFYEPYFQTWFEGDSDTIRNIERSVNRSILLDGFACMNDVYEHIPVIEGIDTKELIKYGWETGDLFSGYCGDGWVEFDAVEGKDEEHGVFYGIHMSVCPWEGWEESCLIDISPEEIYEKYN